jgi:hypothetical protein
VGLAIVILLIGLLIGIYMLLQAKKLWWAFSAWKFKNPAANEPSEAGETPDKPRAYAHCSKCRAATYCEHLLSQRLRAKN